MTTLREAAQALLADFDGRPCVVLDPKDFDRLRAALAAPPTPEREAGFRAGIEAAAGACLYSVDKDRIRALPVPSAPSARCEVYPDGICKDAPPVFVGTCSGCGKPVPSAPTQAAPAVCTCATTGAGECPVFDSGENDLRRIPSGTAPPAPESEAGWVMPKNLNQYGVDHGDGVPYPLAVWPDRSDFATVRVRITVEPAPVDPEETP